MSSLVALGYILRFEMLMNRSRLQKKNLRNIIDEHEVLQKNVGGFSMYDPPK